MRLSALLCASLAASAYGQGTEAGFASGWNGEAVLPPMGWRSWNAMGACIKAGLPGDSSNCSMPNGQPPLAGHGEGAGHHYCPGTCGSIAGAINAVTAKNWTVDGKKVSLADVGYASVGIDEGWEGCGQGVNKTQHDANGNPVINTYRFPDMAKLVEFGHNAGVKMGWYQNGCACGEAVEKDINYQGDIRQLSALGFDAVKFDGCGTQQNNTKYAALMKTTGKNFSVENCHWGANGPIGCKENDDSSACPSVDWCPFNWYRTSGDINASPASWFGNLQTVVPYTQGDRPLSRPSCWAYPDMLEVGRVMTPDGKELDLPWNRAHFGAWCTVSAPLILGMDLYDEHVEAIIPIITNKHAIAVSQSWAGHPGMLLASVDPTAIKPDAAGYVKTTGALTDGSPFGHGPIFVHVANMTLAGAEAWCTAHTVCAAFTFRCHNGTVKTCMPADEKEVKLVYFKGQTATNGDPKWATFIKAKDVPATQYAQQVWGKPLPGGAWAVIAINGNVNATMSVSLPLAQLNMTGPVTVTDIWKDGQAVPGGPVAEQFVVPPVGPRDSGFYKLSPQ